MENIFEGAKFGDKFKTRNGEMAIFWIKDIAGATLFYNDGNKYNVLNDGCLHDLSCFTHPEDHFTVFDVVGKWKEPIDEEEGNH